MDKCPDGEGSIDASDIWPVRAPRVFNLLPEADCLFAKILFQAPKRDKGKGVERSKEGHSSLYLI